MTTVTRLISILMTATAVISMAFTTNVVFAAKPKIPPKVTFKIPDVRVPAVPAAPRRTTLPPAKSTTGALPSLGKPKPDVNRVQPARRPNALPVRRLAADVDRGLPKPKGKPSSFETKATVGGSLILVAMGIGAPLLVQKLVPPEEEVEEQ